MKAFVMKGLDHVGFADKPIPRPGPNDAIVKTTMALICTSDSHTVHGAIGPRENLTLGHEAVGIVHEVGSEVRLFKPGDSASLSAPSRPTGAIPFTQAGHPSQSGGALGGWKFANIKDGVFAEYFHVNEADANLALIPDDVTDETAVYCCDMISTGVMAAENAHTPTRRHGRRLRPWPGWPDGRRGRAAARRRPRHRHRFGAAPPGTCACLWRRRDCRQPQARMSSSGCSRSPAGSASTPPSRRSAARKRCAAAVSVTRPGGTISNAGYHGKGDFVNIPRLDWGVGMAEKSITTSRRPASQAGT